MMDYNKGTPLSTAFLYWLLPGSCSSPPTVDLSDTGRSEHVWCPPCRGHTPSLHSQHCLPTPRIPQHMGTVDHSPTNSHFITV